MRKRPLFAFLFFILFLNIFIHSQEIPDYPDCKVKVSKMAFKIFGCYPLFKSLYYLEMEEIYKKIDKGLQRAYKVAWGNYNTFRNNIKNEDGLPTECIKSAIDSLKNISNRKIEIVFTFDRNYWNYYGFGGLDINNYKANKDGNGGFIISRSSPYKIYISNAYNIGFTYKKYKTTYKNCDYKASISHIVMEMPSDKLTELERKRKEYISEFWEPDGEVKWSLGSLLFHEMVHMSLYHSRSDHNYIKTRFPDEATVEDTTLKIFPSPEKGGMGLNSYDYEYSFSSWAHMKRNIPRDLYFLYNKTYPLARRFNPPVIKEDKDFRYADGTVCDDVRCEDLRKYRKPIRICAKPERPEGSKGGGHGPGNDNADDRYSFSEGIVREYNLAPEAVIFTDGYWQDALKLYGGLKFDGDNVAEQLLESTPFLVIPSGGLFAKEQDSTFKAILEKYVSLGGTIIVFCQQYGSHVENVVPIPDGESLKVYGWRESQSCYNGSIFFKKEDMHPILSSSKMEKATCGIDGYFSAYPSGSTVLLKRTKNNLPGLLYYTYGENGGHVILTSMFTDWAYTHSQATTAELKIVRDLITFAKNPNLPISMYDLETDLNPQIDLNVTVKNNTEDTELTASKVKLVVYTPDRKIVLYETVRKKTCFKREFF